MTTETRHITIEVISNVQQSGKHYLGLKIMDGHVGTSTWFYDHRPGNLANIDIYDLTKLDMLSLAQKIMDVAATIEA